MEYSLYDARRAGFGEAIFVIRAEMVDAFPAFARRFEQFLPWKVAVQRLEDVPEGVAVPRERAKPWGTGHAVLAAAAQVRGPFAVLNADDFYGAPAFAGLGEFLAARASATTPTYGIVGYRLSETLSEAGAVNRGVCRTDRDGWLERIEEILEIRRSQGGAGYEGLGSSGTVALDGGALVSMNLWGFTPAIFDLLRHSFAEFLSEGNLGKREFLLPTIVQGAIDRRAIRVRVLDAKSQWFGMTYPADRPAVEASLRDLVARGEYPPQLWR
jgi:UTP-glucose-1-phosphate uridylyltransferase